MARAVLDEASIHAAIREKVASHQQEIVREVQAAVKAHAVVVVGMAQNPAPRRARRLLDDAAVCASLAMQHGATAQELAKAVGRRSTPIGAALEFAGEVDR